MKQAGINRPACFMIFARATALSAVALSVLISLKMA